MAPGKPETMTQTKRLAAAARAKNRGGDWRILAVVLVGSFMAVLDTMCRS